MNYTQTYRKIYAILKDTNLPHEKVHNASLRITNALSDIYCTVKSINEDMVAGIMEVIKEYSSNVKIGGFDLDDK